MTRGNQREQDRAKAAKKLAELQKSKQKESAASLTRRREEDAQKMREKQAVCSLSLSLFLNRPRYAGLLIIP
ncbi:hypothetical protein VP01_528g2 [Puccinia sorghi]|uniref:Small EDRK-rich factor-like N-terminal domain-containing protein n=1 Tax=Puccinia sorghi TaxID=27349 RepID=A0A0L6UKB1_9BASI|nr:hypothetical protein VP01_528g2 [Puccinia sorghi]